MDKNRPLHAQYPPKYGVNKDISRPYTKRWSTPYFCTYINSKPLTTWGIGAPFRRLKERTGIDDRRVTAHQCRCYMATTQLASGRSPFDVQRQMGHRSLNMTNHYASLTTYQLQRSHEQHSPLRAKSMGDTREMGTGYWEE